MSNKFYDSKGRYVNLDANRPVGAKETIEELKQHPALYQIYLERRRKYAREASRLRFLNPEYRQRRLAQTMEWRKSEAGKLALRNYTRRWRAKNKSQTIAQNVRTRIHHAMFHGNCIPAAEAFLGCAISDYKAYLESKWVAGMSWENHGNRIGKWCIDHIRPVAFYDLADPVQLKECFHFENTAPIWFRDNCSKWHVDKLLI